MQVPVVHLNGTSKQALLDQQADAASALEDAIRILKAAQPNARDFAPRGNGAFDAANAEHIARLLKLESVLKDITNITEASEAQSNV